MWKKSIHVAENGGVLKWILIFLIAVSALLGLSWWKKSHKEPQSGAEVQAERFLAQETKVPEPEKSPPAASKPPLKSAPIPSVDRIDELFNTGLPKLDQIVQTIAYTKTVDWQRGKAAWLGDYANHYATSKHFIARSLNKKADYLKQDVKEGDRFNVYRKDKKIAFHMVVALDQCKMLLYCIDLSANERILLKTYNVGVGRRDPKSLSGSLTPLGTYSLGKKVTIYQPGTLGVFQGKDIEMIRVFGTRWIPFDKEIKNCTAVAKGLGVHGSPWKADPKTGQLVEDSSSIGTFSSDGCIRLTTRDVEEIYAITITQPSYVEIVATFADCQLPGKEK